MSSISGVRAILVWGTTLSLFLLISYAACIVYGLGVPGGMEMHRAWGPWLPGFERLTLEGVIAGAIWCVVYGFWTGLIVVPLRRLVGKIFGEADAAAYRPTSIQPDA